MYWFVWRADEYIKEDFIITIDPPNGDYKEEDGKLILKTTVLMDKKLEGAETHIHMSWSNPNVMNLDLVVVGIKKEDETEMCILIGTRCHLESESCTKCAEGTHRG